MHVPEIFDVMNSQRQKKKKNKENGSGQPNYSSPEQFQDGNFYSQSLCQHCLISTEKNRLVM